MATAQANSQVSDPWFLLGQLPSVAPSAGQVAPGLLEPTLTPLRGVVDAQQRQQLRAGGRVGAAPAVPAPRCARSTPPARPTRLLPMGGEGPGIPGRRTLPRRHCTFPEPRLAGVRHRYDGFDGEQPALLGSVAR